MVNLQTTQSHNLSNTNLAATKGKALEKRANPSFGAIKLSGGADAVLKRVLKPAEWKEFSEIINKQKSNTVDVILFGRGHNSKRLDGRIWPNSSSFSEKNYSQSIFESTMGFIKRCCKKADDIKAKIDKEVVVDVDEILNNITP